MLSETEKSLFSCCEWCKVATLPETWDKKSVWVTSIAKVRKNNGGYFYAYCERAKDGTPRIIRDFGPARAIVEIVEYFPLLYLESTYVKRFPKSDEGTANLTEYLKSNGFPEAEHADNRKELDKLNIRLAIQKQLADAKKKSKLIIKD